MYSVQNTYIKRSGRRQCKPCQRINGAHFRAKRKAIK